MPVTLKVTISKSERDLFAAADKRTGAQVGEFISQSFGSSKAEGAGEAAFVERSDRSDGFVTVNVTKGVNDALAGVADEAKRAKRITGLEALRNTLISDVGGFNLEGAAKLIEEKLQANPNFTDDDIDEVMGAVFPSLYADDDDSDDDDDDGDGDDDN